MSVITDLAQLTTQNQTQQQEIDNLKARVLQLETEYAQDIAAMGTIAHRLDTLETFKREHEAGATRRELDIQQLKGRFGRRR